MQNKDTKKNKKERKNLVTAIKKNVEQPNEYLQ